MNDLIAVPSVENFTKRMMLPKCVLPSNKRGGQSHRHHLDIGELCRRWLEGDNLRLWAEAKRNGNKRKQKASRNDQSAKREAAIHFAED